MQTVLSAGGKKKQKSAVKTSVKIEQTLKACQSFRIYSIQASG